jgi:hypothetical protein
MHDIEPHFRWRLEYTAEEDSRSPFFEREYSEFEYSNKIYNHYIHPQWDEFGSQTLYTKILFVDYDEHFAILEMIGEWNDAIYNDVMYFKRNLINALIDEEIYKFVILCDNVLNFHSSDDSYYEEWYDDIKEEGGWICFVNTFKHVEDEMKSSQLQFYVNFGEVYSDIHWRPQLPHILFQAIEGLVNGSVKRLRF